MSAEAAKLVGRIAPPSDYLFKIKSFSLLTNASVAKFRSDDFETGGYKWRLWIYPTGNKSRDEKKDHISLYLELIKTTSLPTGWEVNAVSRFFVFDHLQNKYFTTKDVLETRYHAMNTTSATVKFIPVDTFSNPANGYILEDDCVFGVEIFIVKSTAKTGCLSMNPEPGTCYHTWKVRNFSSLPDGSQVSEPFGYKKWDIVLYPNGDLEGKGNSISLFLRLQESIAQQNRLLAKIVFRVKNQINGENVEDKLENLYTPSNCRAWGWRRFMSLEKLKEGFLVEDTLIIEVEVTDKVKYFRRLCVYPKGNKSRNVEGQMSIYLELVETVPDGLEITVTANFFIFNHLENKYFGCNAGLGMRYHAMNTICGIDRFLDSNIFSNPFNGYLCGDLCVFGVELFVIEKSSVEGYLSLIEMPFAYNHTWEVTNFSNLVDEKYSSEPFGCYGWTILLYPNGFGEGKGHSISVFLAASKSSIPSGASLYLDFTLRVKDQLNAKHIEINEGNALFEPPDCYSCGWRTFMTLAELLKDPNHGFLVDDSLIIEAEVTLLGVVSKEL